MANSLAPELRFTEFEENNDNSYDKICFNNLFLFSTGKNIKQKEASPDFEIPCVRYGELYHMYNEVINEIINRTNLDKSELLFSKGDEILLPSAGEDPLDIGSASALTIPNVAIGRTINILRPIKNNIYSQIYVSYYINQKLRKKISTLAKGVSISNVYNSDLKKLTITLPNLSEQTKIATFLTAVDKRINLLQKKKAELEHYKKGIMQKMFSQEVRFKKEGNSDFLDSEEKSLGEVCEIKKGKQLNKEELEKAGSYPAINGGIEPSGYTEEWNTIENTITISEGGNSCGYVNFIKTKFWSGGHCYSLLNLKNDVVIEYLYQSLKFNQNRIMRLRVGSGLPNIQKGDITNFKMPFPSKQEQQKIADFLSSIDKSIAQIGNQINDSVVFKKGLLQKILV
jgi:type I restriction enzyme S subunit